MSPDGSDAGCSQGVCHERAVPPAGPDLLEVTQPGARPPGLFSGHRPFASVPANVEKMFSYCERQLSAKNLRVALKSLSLQIPSPGETAAPSEVGSRAVGLERGGPSEAFNQDR